MCRNKNAIDGEGNGKPLHAVNFPKKSSQPCLWFLLRSKSSMQHSFRLATCVSAGAPGPAEYKLNTMDDEVKNSDVSNITETLLDQLEKGDASLLAYKLKLRRCWWQIATISI